MGDDHLDHADVEPERDRTVRRSNRSPGPICRTRLTLFRARLGVVDQPRAVEVTDLLLPEIALERRERGGLGSRRGGFPTSHISVI